MAAQVAHDDPGERVGVDELGSRCLQVGGTEGFDLVHVLVEIAVRQSERQDVGVRARDFARCLVAAGQAQHQGILGGPDLGLRGLMRAREPRSSFSVSWMESAVLSVCTRALTTNGRCPLASIRLLPAP